MVILYYADENENSLMLDTVETVMYDEECTVTTRDEENYRLGGCLVFCMSDETYTYVQMDSARANSLILELYMKGTCDLRDFTKVLLVNPEEGTPEDIELLEALSTNYKYGD